MNSVGVYRLKFGSNDGTVKMHRKRLVMRNKVLMLHESVLRRKNEKKLQLKRKN